MILTNSSAAKMGSSNASAIASSTASFCQFMVYAATTLSSVISGAIGLVKNGNGTLTLNAANTFTGAVVINAGTLATGASGSLADTANVLINSGGNYTVGAVDTITSIAGAGSLQLGANLTMGTSTFSGNIAGTSKIVTSGTLTFSGNNSSWTGGMSVLNGAILIAGADNAFGTGILAGGNAFIATIRSSDATARTLGNTISRTASAGGTLTFGSVGTGNLTFAGGYFSSTGILSIITVLNAQTQLNGSVNSTSTGLFTKAGSGTLILNANNTYIAPTTISAGTLEIGASGRLGSGSYAGNIINNAAFIYSGTANQILSGIISGTGTLTKNAASTLTISGTYSGTTGAVTINAGTLDLGANQTLPAIAGVGNINIGIYNLTIAMGTNNTFSGVISGSGTFRKTGSGTLTLLGNSTYTGSTQISIGTLRVIRAFGSITPTASFGASTLDVSFTGTFSSGTTDFRFFQGTTINSYAAVTLTGVPVGTTAIYNSTTSTLAVTVP